MFLELNKQELCTPCVAPLTDCAFCGTVMSEDALPADTVFCCSAMNGEASLFFKHNTGDGSLC